MSSMTHQLQGKVLYQIYPRSFCDSNHDGVGDLRGITQKLDYLRGGKDSLNVDIIWISPFYPSPMADFGYDVSDYRAIDPIFGALDDFQELLLGAHQRGLQVFIDFVPNHTSDEHEWFKDSRSSRNSPKRDWYVWHDPLANGSEPNNWQSVFGGSAWEYDDVSDQYYLHSFLSKQPDLNWDNPEVRTAMTDVMRFWLDMGVDGFRIDAVSWMSKDPDMRNDYSAEGDDTQPISTQYSKNGPHLFEYLSEMAATVASYANRFMITEAYPRSWDDATDYAQFYANVDASVSAPFNFEGIFAPWDASHYHGFIDGFLHEIHHSYLPIFCFGNHDQPRIASRIGSSAARAAAVLLLTLPGLSVIYYGEELGMNDRYIAETKVKDPFEKNQPYQGFGRDPHRTPMPWDDSLYGGFSSVEPWLPTGNLVQQNVKTQTGQASSILHLYRRMIQFRQKLPALQRGTYHSFKTPEHIFGFQRCTDSDSVTILVNFSRSPITVTHEFVVGNVLVSTHVRPPLRVEGSIELRPNEAVVIDFPN